MSWRKWLVRGLVFSILGGLAAAGWLYQRVTDPVAVRRQVLDKLAVYFPGASIHVASARMRLLGGIGLTDLRLCRKDDSDRADLLTVPGAVIHYDKEQLLDGKLVISKVEFERLRLHIVRTRDGHWNLRGILGVVRLDQALPIMVIRNGTILLEDQQAAPGTPPVEIKNVNLNFINDPVPVVTFAGTGTADAVGPVQLRGTWHRATWEIALTVDAPAVAAGPTLVERLAGYAPQLAAHARQFEATCRLHADLGYHPTAPQPWTYDVQCQVSGGKLTHARLPAPLDHLEATLHWANGQVTDAHVAALADAHCLGRAEPVPIRLAVRDFTPGLSGKLEDCLKSLQLEIDHLPVTCAVFDCLPDNLKELQKDYVPEGPVSVTYTLRHEAGGQWCKQCVIHPEGVHASAQKYFPYPLEQITGTIEQQTSSAQPDLLKFDLAARAAGRPVRVQGEMHGTKPDIDLTLDIRGDDVPLDDQLLDGLRSDKLRALARSFAPSGRVDVQARLRRAAGSPQLDYRYLIGVRQGQVRYEKFAYPLEEVSGVIEVRPDHWEFREFRGTHKGGEFHAVGRSYHQEGGDRVTLAIAGSRVLLDPELRAALQPELQHTWAKFEPEGRIDFDCQVGLRLTPDTPPPQLEVTVVPQGCSIRPDFFRYALNDVRGRLHYADHRLDLEKLTARHGPTVFRLDEATVYLKPGGGVWAGLTNLQGAPIVPDADFLAALPGLLQRGCAALHVQDPLTLRTQLVVETSPEPGQPPDVYWDGVIGLQNAGLGAGLRFEHVTGEIACRGRHNSHGLEGVLGNLQVKEATFFGQPVRDLQGPLWISPQTPGVLQLPGLHAQVFGGEVYGAVHLKLEAPLSYELELMASQIKLEEVGRQNLNRESELSGLAFAHLYLTGQGSDFKSFKGRGSIDVPKGKMGNLPLLLDLLKFLSLRLPDRTFFEEAHTKFEIEGSRAHFSELNLYGNAISVRGQGGMNLDGTDLNMDLNVDWGRLVQVLSPAVKKIPETISNQLLKINMRAERLGEKPKFTQEPIPPLVEPLKKLFNGWRDPADK